MQILMNLNVLFTSLRLLTRVSAYSIQFHRLHVCMRLTFINVANVSLLNVAWCALIFTQHEKNTRVILCPVGAYDAYH